MIEQQKIDHLIFLEKVFSTNLRFGDLRGNKNFIDPFLNYLSILEESQYWPEDLRNEIRLRRLEKLMSYLSKNSSFWAEYFKKNNFDSNTIDTLDRLDSLPILRRADLLEFGEKIYVVNDENKDYISSQNSSGTSGIPTKFLFDNREQLTAAFALQFRHPFLMKLPLRNMLERKFIVMLGGKGAAYLLAKDFVVKVFQVAPADLEDKDIRLSIYNAIEQARPTLLISFPSLLIKLAQMINEDKISLPLLAIQLSGESISAEDNVFLQKIFNVPIANLVSNSGLGGAIGFECGKQFGVFHLNAEQVMLEFIDENDKKVPLGKDGELTITSLAYSATPLLRYAIDDTGNFLTTKCVCGKTLPVFNFIGRRNNEFILPSGNRIGALHFYIALAYAQIQRYSKQFQIIQEDKNLLRLLIVPKMRPNITHEAKFRLALTKLFQNEKVFIEIDYVERIPERGRKPVFFIPLSQD